MVKIVASVALFSGLSAAAQEPPDNAFCNHEKTACVTAVPSPGGTRLTAFLRQPDGSFLEVDVSAVEGQNFGKLGRRRAEYNRFETRPTEWVARQDELLQVNVRTQAWRAGQRYTVWEPLVFRRDGKVSWR